MTILSSLRQEIIVVIQKIFVLDADQLRSVEVTLNSDKDKTFGDLSCNGAMVLSKVLGKNPRVLAQQIQQALKESDNHSLQAFIQDVEIAGPGFLNITLNQDAWQQIMLEMLNRKGEYFKLGSCDEKLKYLVEFVSVNPTGPMHLGSGRNGIIGDVLCKVLAFLGHSVHKEFYINDAGNQMKLLGRSFQVRCQQLFDWQVSIPEEGYEGEYLIDMARECVQEFGDEILAKEEQFFVTYAKEHLLQLIEHDLTSFGIVFDQWFSEKTLHDNGEVAHALEILKQRDLAYEKDGAWWFRATDFGDDKDRVLKKSDGEMTYITADIAYHKNKFDRGFDRLINVWGQDHHGYVKRLKGTMQALGCDSDRLDIILYQLVSIKENDVVLKMSKRAGIFTKLRDVLDEVGSDVSRFFFLNRKAEAHLEFDLAVALKKTEENPVYYLQYAYVRTGSLLAKAALEPALADYVASLKVNKEHSFDGLALGDSEIEVLRKIATLQDILKTIAGSYQTHLIAYYALELAHKLHNYYAHNRIIDTSNVSITKMRLLMIVLLQNTLKICLDLLGVSCPEKM